MRSFPEGLLDLQPYCYQADNPGNALIVFQARKRSASCPNSQPIRSIRPLRIGDNPRSATSWRFATAQTLGAPPSRRIRPKIKLDLAGGWTNADDMKWKATVCFLNQTK